jgi:hypothetical protein
VGRNSYGQNWGVNGWFKIERGAGVLNLDAQACSWATPSATGAVFLFPTSIFFFSYTICIIVFFQFFFPSFLVAAIVGFKSVSFLLVFSPFVFFLKKTADVARLVAQFESSL